MGMASSEKLHGIINYLDNDEFEHVEANHSLRKWDCAVAAFTGFDDPDAPRIYVNRKFATPATLIHELLHLLTHPAFHKEFGKSQPGFVEGMTEYFTRAVQGNTTGTNPLFKEFCDELSPRAGHYDKEMKKVNLIDQRKLTQAAPKTPPTNEHPDGKPMRDVMEQAYFHGHSDAIAVLSLASRHPVRGKYRQA